MNAAEVDVRAKDLLDVLGLVEAGRTLVVDYSRHEEEDRPRLCAAARAAPARPGRAFRGRRSGFRRGHPDILHRYVHGGGTVIFSSHVMEVVEKLCTHVAILADGRIKAVGTLDEVRAGRDLEDVFVQVVGGRTATGQELSWL